LQGQPALRDFHLELPYASKTGFSVECWEGAFGVISDGSEDAKKGNRNEQTQTWDGWKVYEDVHLPSAQTYVFVSSKSMILWIGPNAVGSNLEDDRPN